MSDIQFNGTVKEFCNKAVEDFEKGRAEEEQPMPDFRSRSNKLWEIVRETGRSAETVGYIEHALKCSWKEANRIAREYVITSESTALCMLQDEWRKRH